MFYILNKKNFLRILTKVQKINFLCLARTTLLVMSTDLILYNTSLYNAYIENKDSLYTLKTHIKKYRFFLKKRCYEFH